MVRKEGVTPMRPGEEKELERAGGKHQRQKYDKTKQ